MTDSLGIRNCFALSVGAEPAARCLLFSFTLLLCGLPAASYLRLAVLGATCDFSAVHRLSLQGMAYRRACEAASNKSYEGDIRRAYKL